MTGTRDSSDSAAGRTYSEPVTGTRGPAAPGQAALKLAFDNWLGSTGYDEDGMFGADEMELAFQAGAEAERDCAAVAAQAVNGMTPGQAVRAAFLAVVQHRGGESAEWHTSWDELPQDFRDDWERIAQAAIAAQLQPSATQAAAWAAWYDADAASRTMAQDFRESKYDAMRRAFLAGQQAAIAAQQRPAPGACSSCGQSGGPYCDDEGNEDDPFDVPIVRSGKSDIRVITGQPAPELAAAMPVTGLAMLPLGTAWRLLNETRERLGEAAALHLSAAAERDKLSAAMRKLRSAMEDAPTASIARREALEILNAGALGLPS